ncbi:unnamed protein product [Boreogadus saida]
MDDDAYSYALVVELEENNVPRLKNKLVKYFQSKKRAGGGECKIQYEERSRTAVLRFRREEDRARVVAQETHEIVLDEGRLKVTVHLPEESPGRPLTTTSNKEQSNPDGRAAEEETLVEAVSREEHTEEPALGSTSTVLENVPQDKGKEFMEMLVLNICKNFKSPMTTQPEFSLEMLSDTCSIVVTFSSAKENNQFITSCQTNRTFLNNKLAVRALEVTSQVKVEDVSNIKEDVLLLYFENGGWEVEQVTPDEEEQSAVILFKMATAVQGIIQKEHFIGKKWVKVFPFYDSLGTALYGKDRPTPKLPAAFSQSIYSPLLKYLHQNQEAAEMACGHLSTQFCKVDLLPSSVSFSPLPALLEQKDVKAKDIKQWKQSVEQAFTQVLSRFKTLKLQPPLSAWEECEAQIREIVLDKTVEIIAEKAEGTLSVVGLVDDVTRLEPTLNDLLTRIEKRLLRENSSITQEFEISKEECDKIQIQGGELKPGDSVITGAGGRLQCKKVIHVVGPQYDPSNHQRTVGQLKRAVKGSLELAEMSGCQSLAISAISANMGFPIDLCADTIIKVMKEHCEDHFGQNPLKQIHFVSLDDHAVQAFEKAVRDKFGNQGRIGSRQSVPDKQNKNSSKPLGNDVGMRIQSGNIEDATTQVVVNVVGKELDLETGAVSKAILSAAGPKLQYLVNEQRKTGDIGDVIVTDGCKLKSNWVFHAVVPAWDKQGNALKIMRGIVADCLNKAEKHGLTSISFPAIGTGNLGFPKDLAASVMMEEVSKFYKQPRCLKTVVIVLYPKDQETIQVFTDAFNKQLPTTTNVPAPTQSKSSLFSKVTLASGRHEITIGHVRVQVVSGDITKEKTDVIVNSSNESFTLKSGVSKAILDAAGPTVENECNKLGGQPNTGMILTTPGNLMCKKDTPLGRTQQPPGHQRYNERCSCIG